MFSQRLRNLGFLLALVALFHFSPNSAASFVLCVGSDGHTQVEPGRDGKCDDVLLSDLTGPLSVNQAKASSQDCNPCVDYFIGNGSQALTPTKGAQINPFQFYGVVFGSALILPPSRKIASLQNVFPSSLKSIHPRSIVLRI